MSDNTTLPENENHIRHHGSQNQQVASAVNSLLNGPNHHIGPRIVVLDRYNQSSRGFFIARKMLRRRHIMKERREKRELEERKRKMSKE